MRNHRLPVSSWLRGGTVVASMAEIHTQTGASITAAPRLSFSITAEGEGTVSAGIEALSLKGDNGNLSAVVSFSDHASASGIWTFAKAMSYNSLAGLPTVMPEPWYLVP